MSRKGMAKKEKKKQTGGWRAAVRRVVALMSWVSAALLCLCTYSESVSPAVLPILGVLGLGFPFFLAAVLFMLLVCLVLHRRMALVLLLVLICCGGTIYSYCPINIPSPEPAGCLKVMTWNTQGFCYTKQEDDGTFSAVEYMRKSDADIIAFQEAWTSVAFFKRVVKRLERRFPYRDTLRINNNTFGVFSRYPVVGKRCLARGTGNGGGVFLIKLAGGDTLRLVNLHLESMGLAVQDRTAWSDMVHKSDTATLDEAEQRRLLGKIMSSTARRAEQVDKVSDYIFHHRHQPLILCGDFNDTPVSYAHHRMNKWLTDAYAATATGVGRTFNKDAMYVRIDHMFCSEHWRPFSCRIQNENKLSDHYPMTCSFKRVKQ